MAIPGDTCKTYDLFTLLPYLLSLFLLYKNLAAIQETLVQFLGQEDLLEKG